MYAVVRLRGNVNVDGETEDTLEMLNLKNKFNCVVIPENESYEGMLEKAQKVITWGRIDEDVLIELLRKRGLVEGNKKLVDNLDELGQDNIEDIVKELNKKSVRDLGIKVPFKLTPPSGGFKSNLKVLYPKGELGNRGSEINELLDRMI